MRKEGSLLIRNVRAVLPDRVTEPTAILIEQGRITAINGNPETKADEFWDAAGGILFPGLVDMHVHGGGGADFMDATPYAFETVVKAHLARGTTTIVPTAMTATKEELLAFIKAYHDFKEKSAYAPLVCGLHLEGPYFSKANGKSQGAQSGKLIREIDFGEVHEILSAAEGSILRWDAAPEIAGSERFAALMKEQGILCSAAHTDATAEEAQKGFEAGFSHVTHFYNAVTAYRKKDQQVLAGVVEAAYLDDNVTVELICDGRHIPKHCMQLALKIKGADKVMGITDAMRMAGTDRKRGMLGSLTNGTEVIVDDGVAKLPDLSSYAGSIATMDRALQVVCREYGIDPVVAAKMLASNPAGLLNIHDRKGTIAVGKDADFVLVDEQYRIQDVLLGGRLVG